jgi:hypothetical protein
VYFVLSIRTLVLLYPTSYFSCLCITQIVNIVLSVFNLMSDYDLRIPYFSSTQYKDERLTFLIDKYLDLRHSNSRGISLILAS